MFKSRLLLSSLLIVILTTFLVMPFSIRTIAMEEDEIDNGPNNTVISERYSTIFENWKALGLKDDIPFWDVIFPIDFILEEGKSLLSVSDSKGYSEPVYNWDDNSIIEFYTTVEQTGLYEIIIDYYSTSDSIVPIEIAVKVNDEIQYLEASQITLDKLWKSEVDEFGVDRFNNDVMPKQTQVATWLSQPFRDTTRLYDEPLRFKLNEGLNKITLSKTRGTLLVGKITIKNKDTLDNYEEYLVKHNYMEMMKDTIITIEAEKPTYKNSASIRPGTSRYPSVKPFALTALKLNTLSGDTYKRAGNRVDYKIIVPESGFYNITLKVQQKGKTNSPVYRTLYVNGEIPFKEAKYLSFNYSRAWQNVTIGDINGSPYKIYLLKGENTISFEVNSSLYRDVYENISRIMMEINKLTLDIKKLTGNSTDKERDWEITEFLPDIESQLKQYSEDIYGYIGFIRSYNVDKKNSPITVSLRLAAERLESLSKKPNDLPKKLDVLSEGSNSVSQLLASVLPSLIDQPLTIDAIYVHGANVKLPRPTTGFFTRLWIGIQRFFLSFFQDNYDDKAKPDELEIWVDRSRYYVDIMQKMTDDDFTKKTGIKVKFSIMQGENKLILANSANKEPDIAMGVNTVFDLAVRGALYDMRQFSGFDSFLGTFNPGSLIPYVYDDGIYGIPETQNFYVLFYRKDILDSLGIPVPNTWEEVIEILPELQQYGMNFYTNLSVGTSLKGYNATSPFIYQFGGKYFEDDGFSAAVDNENTIEAIRFMTELFTIYSMPLQVGSFYNEFRYGTIPIGISDFGTYVQLTYAAPEIAGLWDIALLPGIEKDGEILRYGPGTGPATVVLHKSDKKDEAWEFIKWWNSYEVQVEFCNIIQTTLGPEYLYNTSNVRAFEQIAIPEEHKEIILEQFTWLRGVPNIPGGYMVEREVSNIWNKVVFDGENLQNAIDEGVITMDKEITRKMIEFGYLDKNGKVIKPYKLPSIELIESWLKNSE